MRIFLTLAVTIGIFVAGTASAQIVTEEQRFANSSAIVQSNSEIRGQALIVPAGVTRLQQFTLQVAGDVTPVVRAYDNVNSTVGAVLYEGETLANAPNGDVTTIIPAGGLAVTPGSYIFIGVQNRSGQVGRIQISSTHYYENGMFVDLNHAGVSRTFSHLDAYFIAVFGPEPPASIPTMTEWAMVLLGVMLAGGAALYIQRRRVTA